MKLGNSVHTLTPILMAKYKLFSDMEYIVQNKVVQMGPNRCLTYIWTVFNMIPLTPEPSHNRSIRQGENVYQPLQRGWGESEDR